MELTFLSVAVRFSMFVRPIRHTPSRFDLLSSWLVTNTDFDALALFKRSAYRWTWQNIERLSCKTSFFTPLIMEWLYNLILSLLVNNLEIVIDYSISKFSRKLNKINSLIKTPLQSWMSLCVPFFWVFIWSLNHE